MSKIKDKQILVTGSTGFLGSYLLRYLVHEGYIRIRALKRADSHMDLVADIKSQIEWIKCDMLDIIGLEDAMQGVQQVYHCAAVVAFDAREFERMRKVNVDGTANVINAALHAKVEKFVHVSSIAAIGRTKGSNIVNEATKWERNNFNSEYAISKYLSENEAWRGLAEGLNVAIVNPSVILGAGRWDDGPLKFFKLVWKNFPFYTKSTSGFVDVRDVARFMVHLMESDKTGERYILNAENLTYQAIMNEIATNLNKKRPRIEVTPFIQQLAWRADWLRSRLLGKKPFITREVARLAMRSFEYENKKSLSQFDFEYTPIRQTIAETSRQFREAAENGFESKVLPLV
ncbi:MAG: NAD-dependent epimerase/dehydratase family protein [Saprospiraceae bacterium]|nr:NAD-dependent epimerase/dehydratase family protein [Saprospiraceae bacterium]